MNNEKFNFKKRIKSFSYAFRGITDLVKNEHNARIHCVAAVAVLIAGFILHLSDIEWVAVTICIGGVFMAEGFNSAIETLADKICKEDDLLIKRAKDIAAGAVLIMAITSVVVGLIIFLPKIIRLF